MNPAEIVVREVQPDSRFERRLSHGRLEGRNLVERVTALSFS